MTRDMHETSASTTPTYIFLSLIFTSLSFLLLRTSPLHISLFLTEISPLLVKSLIKLDTLDGAQP